MGVLDDIARLGTGTTPVSAFLVGRENQRQADRQAAIDAQNAQTAALTNELRGLQVEALKNQPAIAQQEQQAEMSRKADLSRQIALNPAIPKDAKSMAVSMVQNGRDDEAFELLKPYFKPEGADTEKPNARELKVQDTMSTFGLSRAEAVKLVDNHARIDRDDFGRAVYVDEVTGTVKEIVPTPVAEGPQQDSPAASTENDAPPTLFESARDATGPVNTIANAITVLGSAVGAPLAAEATVATRQRFNVEQNAFLRSLALNPRFPVAEIERLKDEIKMEPDFWTSPDIMQVRMREVDTSLRSRLRREYEVANDTTQGDTTRRDASKAAKDIKAFLEVMGVPPESWTANGGTAAQWATLTISERDAFRSGQ